MSVAPSRIPVGITIAVAFSLTILIGLGTWQLQRLSWKEGLLARVAALQAAAPISGDAALERMGAGADLDFTRVRLTCVGLTSAPYLELFSVREGKAGSRLVSACRVASSRYKTLLVDRGFVIDEVSARPPVNVSDLAPVEMVGVLRKPEPGNLFSPANDAAANRWYVRDVPAMAAALNTEPVLVVAKSDTGDGIEPMPVDTAGIPNDHLGYAIQWFGMATVWLGMTAYLLWRIRRRTV